MQCNHKMALQPSLRSLIIMGSPNAMHTLDVFLDYVCPYSGKMAYKLETIVKPILQSRYKDDQVKVIFRPQVQPWHAMSTITHEAALAALRASPKSFWPYSLALFKTQAEYYDIPTQDLPIRQIREKLALLAANVLPPDSVATFKDLLAFKGASNAGNAVTDDLKYTIKFSRQNGIHVSPSVLWNGLFQSEIDSQWQEKDWSEFLAKKLST